MLGYGYGYGEGCRLMLPLLWLFVSSYYVCWLMDVVLIYAAVYCNA